MNSTMTYELARNRAEKILEWIGSFAVRKEIAGSVRRQRPLCGDIDIVCIPRIEVSKDMFGEEISRRNCLHEKLKCYVTASEGCARWLSGGESAGDVCSLQLPKCQLDIFFATEETWGTRLLCRTGSIEHNIWLASRAKQLGGHWNPFSGLQLGLGEKIYARTEEEIYDALGLAYIAPQDREANLFPR
jgi:DNA polymerase (family 10)